MEAAGRTEGGEGGSRPTRQEGVQGGVCTGAALEQRGCERSDREKQRKKKKKKKGEGSE
jgi:hypothetical protein